MVDDGRIDRALADRRGDLQVKDEIRDDVEGRRKRDRLLRLEHAGRYDGRDGIGGVVKAVHEIEHERDDHEQRDGPDGELNRMHRMGVVITVTESARR